MAMTVIGVMAVGARALAFATPAIAEQAGSGPPLAQAGADGGLSTGLLIAGIALAFAVGLAGGHVYRRRRGVQTERQVPAMAAMAVEAPARPAPPPPEPAPAPAPRTVELPTPAPPPPPPPPPPSRIAKILHLAAPERPAPPWRADRAPGAGDGGDGGRGPGPAGAPTA